MKSGFASPEDGTAIAGDSAAPPVSSPSGNAGSKSDARASEALAPAAVAALSDGAVSERLTGAREAASRPGHAQMLEREPELAARLVEQAEVEVAAEVAGGALDRRSELLLGLRQAAGLEEDQPEVGAENLGAGVVLEELPRRRSGLVVAAALELEQRDEVEDVLVLRPQRTRLLQLGPRLVEVPAPHRAAGAVQVQQEETLIHGGKVAGGARHGRAG